MPRWSRLPPQHSSSSNPSQFSTRIYLSNISGKSSRSKFWMPSLAEKSKDRIISAKYRRRQLTTRSKTSRNYFRMKVFMRQFRKWPNWVISLPTSNNLRSSRIIAAKNKKEKMRLCKEGSVSWKKNWLMKLTIIKLNKRWCKKWPKKLRKINWSEKRCRIRSMRF